MVTAATISRGAKATGIDFSAEAVEIATSKVTGADIHEGDTQSLSFKKNIAIPALVCIMLIAARMVLTEQLIKRWKNLYRFNSYCLIQPHPPARFHQYGGRSRR